MREDVQNPENREANTTAPKTDAASAALRTDNPVGSFELVYEGRDGRLCGFKDKQGHFSAVRSSRLI